MLKVLYLGDIMGRPGRDVVRYILPKLRETYTPDLVIAQSENVSHGKGISPGHVHELQKLGIDVFTGGNHTIERPAVKPLLADAAVPVLAPINQEGVELAWGAKRVATAKGDVLVVSLLGSVFPTPFPMRNPLLVIDDLLASDKSKGVVGTIVNFHADLSSEKRVIGYYLDGRVSAVIGDHWHVPSADAMVLPKGTAHITDAGMCGTLHSSLGVTKEIIVARWRDGAKLKNDIAEGGPWQANGVVVTIDTKTGFAKKIVQVNEVIEKLQ
ncbi:MAG TPA: TIGR00282 family metallophosphoesterase [Candidatus Saccharimonadales bacterium]|nr:TIGR00282 family metallophosphoesterase [Candidatus Saccharimonadales bacterium]